jgi:aromatic ring-cleaving dioxygenase
VQNPPFLSYHVHVLFWGNNATSTASAQAFLHDFARDLAPGGSLPNCTDNGSALIYPGGGERGAGMAMCFGGSQPGPIGPFLTAQWYAAFGLDALGAVMPWLMRHRAEYALTDAFVHPVTGCDTQDHLKRSVWLGHKWQLDPSGLACDKVGCDGDAHAHTCTDNCYGTA